MYLIKDKLIFKCLDVKADFIITSRINWRIIPENHDKLSFQNNAKHYLK
jgi:hypothetical protein